MQYDDQERFETTQKADLTNYRHCTFRGGRVECGGAPSVLMPSMPDDPGAVTWISLFMPSGCGPTIS